ncbi:WSC domain-containing protein ARB_07867-like isoform X2 [Pomacea canaliculata]|uniref:WSC domain-containing protein ARB_07867-like isoform X2 n=1 Tax=Pomacea canaliculata TaxID=400727 RepID=UPI000D72735D|nr:WSC domain-containing protein ARB_07867-like isoform X2 [Pomacea canaliculata]
MSVLVQKICVLYAIIYSLSLSAATVKASAASKVDLPAVGQSHYLGCWQDADEGKDKHRATVARDLTVNVVTCIPMCWNLRHLYALLKNGRECICTSSMNSLQPSYTTKCTMQCAGNNAYPCGSQDHVSAFHTGYIPEPDYTIMLESIPDALMGCYTDYNKKFCRDASSFETPRLSVGMCMSMCEEHLALYAGLQAGTKCCCNSSVDGTVLVEPDACFRTCGDGQPFKCGGGNFHLSIYRTGITVKRPIISSFEKLVWMNSHISTLAEEIAEDREKLNKNAMVAFWVLVSLVVTAVIVTAACCVCRYALPPNRSSGYQTAATT